MKVFRSIIICFWVVNSCLYCEQQENISLTLNEAIRLALHGNNQIRASQYALKRASWDQVNAWSGLLPSVSASSRYMWIDDETFALRDFRQYLPPELKDQIPQTVFQESYYTSIDASVVLFNANLWNGLRIAGSGRKMAKANLSSSQQQIVFQVIAGYLNLLKAQELLKLQSEYEALSERNFQKAQRLESAGRYSSSEVLRWKMDFQQQKSLVAAQASQLRSGQSLLGRLINREIDQFANVQGAVPERITLESQRLMAMDEAELLQMIQLNDQALIKANAALSAMEAGTQTSKQAFQGSLGNYLPTVSASYSYAWRENGTLDLDDYNPQTFLINVSVPLFTGFGNVTTSKSAYYAYKEQQQQFEDQLKNTRFLLTDLVNRLITLRAQQELAKTNVEFSEKNYRVVENQKEKGLVSNLEFIDAKLSLQNANINAVNTEHDFIITMVEFYYLLGKLDTFIEF